MKTFTLIFVLGMISSCATKAPDFSKEKVCSNESLKYLKNPRNKWKKSVQSPKLIQEMTRTQPSMQQCYEDFKKRTGAEEFNTCLVVGVDGRGKTEFHNFSSKEARLDQAFLNCARSVTRKVPYAKYGKNYILVQSYQFYYH